MSTIKALLGVAVLILSLRVNAAVVTFEDVADPTDINGAVIFRPSSNQYLETGGLIFNPTTTSENIHVQTAAFQDARTFSNNGSNILSSYSNAGGPSIEMFSENLFSINSIDFAEYGISATGPSTLDSLLITGYFSNGNSISRFIQLDGFTDGKDGVDDFQNEIFDNSWSGLTYIEIGSDDGPARNVFYMDNFDFEISENLNPLYHNLLPSPSSFMQPISTVPEPSVISLMIVGLFGIMSNWLKASHMTNLGGKQQF